MQLDAFNNAEYEKAVDIIRPCLDIQRWIEGIVEARPYVSTEALMQQARAVAEPFDDSEIDAGLAHHPRIGERAAGDNAEARMSVSEQAGLGDSSAELEQALRQGNRDYEEKFDRVFLIRAAGRNRADILSELRRRMHLSDQDELRVVGDQLREIALGRLENIIET